MYHLRKKNYFYGTVLDLWIVGQIYWSKGTFGRHRVFYSKNPNSSCLSAKHAIPLRMMTVKAIQRNINSSFPIISSLEMSRICIMFLSLKRLGCMFALSYIFWLSCFRWSTGILKFHSLVNICLQTFFFKQSKDPNQNNIYTLSSVSDF